MKVASIFSGSAIVCVALLNASLILTASSSSAEPLAQEQQQASKSTEPNTETTQTGSLGTIVASTMNEPAPAAPPSSYVATAYSLKGRTASGLPVSKGVIAADPRLLPLGSRVRLEAGSYSGEYVVADTGGAVRGRRIDIWTPTSREAMRFGRRVIKLTVLSYGGRRKVSRKK